MTTPVLQAKHSHLRRGIFSRPIDKQQADGPPLVIETLRQHFGPKFSPPTAILPPPSDPDRLRYELTKIAPAACETRCSLMNLISSKSVAIIVRKFHLPTCTIDERKVLLYSLSANMRYPNATDARDTVVWPIIVRTTDQVNDGAQGANYFVKHSASATEAESRTDSAFAAEPERYFFLYVNQAARCGGGLSRVGSNAEGRVAAATHRNRLFSFCAPRSFPRAGHATPTYPFAPILTGTNAIRRRPDTLAKGLQGPPDFDTPGVREAAKQLMHSLEHAPEEPVMNLQDDSMVLVDNQRAVHARTAFRRRERLLCRVRFHIKKRAR